MTRTKSAFVMALLCVALGAAPFLATEAASCTNSELDIVLCLDGSGSMTGNYDKVQKFSRDLVSKFTISSTEIHSSAGILHKVTGTSPVFKAARLTLTMRSPCLCRGHDPYR